MGYITYLGYGVVFAGIFLFIYIKIKDRKKDIKVIEKRKCKKFAILIPARYESNVIEELLISIEKETSLKDTYVIVESNTDPTCEIVKKHGGNIYIRKKEDMINRNRKGYALDEALKEIIKTNDYDLYFIFDADNIVKKGFFKNMIDSYEEGYDICTAYRNIKNDENKVSACSELIFIMINTILNNQKTKTGKAITISGTGFYISGKLVNKLNGYPFYSLTEDYELSLYASANKINTYYNSNAEFFDTQPINIKTSITQRTRWVKGFFESRRKRLFEIKDDYSKIFGILPILFIIIGIMIVFIPQLINLFTSIILNYKLILKSLFVILYIPITIYFFLLIITIILFYIDKNRVNIKKENKIKAVLYNPIFLFTFIICLIKAINNKNLVWEKIEH